jgi:hypothetical protein
MAAIEGDRKASLEEGSDEPLFIPRDEEDARYSVSFSLDDALRDPTDFHAFLRLYGVVVVRDVLSEAEAAATVDEQFEMCERLSEGFHRDATDKWSRFHGKSKFGLTSRDPLFTRRLLENRQNPRVLDALALALSGCVTNVPSGHSEDGVARYSRRDIIVSHDRAGILRPTKGAEGSAAFASPWSVHLDMDPWKYLADEPGPTEKAVEALTYSTLGDFTTENNLPQRRHGRSVQAVINLLDNHEEDGGFQCVPGFHGDEFDRFFAEVTRARPPLDDEGHPIYGRNMFAFSQTGVPLHRAVVWRAQRVPVRVGSMIIWNQRLPHGTNSNVSERPRMAQFIRAFPRSICSKERLRRRATAVFGEVSRVRDFELSEDGARAFGRAD